MIEIRGVSKYFTSNGVMALENANFSLRTGEIHALLGENGTGKSTLMHILAGYFPPDSGTILVDGIERHFSSTADALALKIGMLRQHPAYVRGFKVWEDCILGAEGVVGGKLFFNPGNLKKRVEELSTKWKFDLPLESRSESLTISQRQKAAVLALLLRNVKYFIFDEPSTVLRPEESNAFFELLNRLRSEGRGIILITHKLQEALAVSDRITVIRRGMTGESRNTKELSIEDLKESIFETTTAQLTSKRGEIGFPIRQAPRRPVLEIKDLHLEKCGFPQLKNVNLCLRAGEILGITGVRNGGIETLELALVGLLSKSVIKGSITLNGHETSGKGVRAFRDAGGAYLGADRLGKNLAVGFPISESLIIHSHRRSRRGLGIFLDTNSLNFWCQKIISKAGITRSVSDMSSSFSGGMLQRILLAREFAEEASLLVLAEAGSGLDQQNRLKLEEELKTYAGCGAAVLLFSTDMEELLPIADEIMVLKNGVLGAYP